MFLQLFTLTNTYIYSFLLFLSQFFRHVAAIIFKLANIFPKIVKKVQTFDTLSEFCCKIEWYTKSLYAVLYFHSKHPDFGGELGYFLFIYLAFIHLKLFYFYMFPCWCKRKHPVMFSVDPAGKVLGFEDKNVSMAWCGISLTALYIS